MSGLNSLSGLSNVSVDFRPTITANTPNTGNVTQPLLPEAEIAPENARSRKWPRQRASYASWTKKTTTR